MKKLTRKGGEMLDEVLQMVADWENGDSSRLGRRNRRIMQEFKINEYITLKLVDNKTYIYLNGKKFLKCIRVVLQIPMDDFKEYDSINSIDEAVEVTKHLYKNQIVEGPNARLARDQDHSITSEQEFWGHCSNLQAWVENEYNTSLLHSNLAFPLLKQLSYIGDKIAKKVYKEEIIQRLKSNYAPVVEYLVNNSYLDIFNKEELDLIIEDLQNNECTKTLDMLEVLSVFENYPNRYGWKDIIKEMLFMKKGIHTIEELKGRKAFVMNLPRPLYYSNEHYVDYLTLMDGRSFNYENSIHPLVSRSGIKVEFVEPPYFKILSNPFYESISELRRIAIKAFQTKNQVITTNYIPRRFKSMFNRIGRSKYELTPHGAYTASELCYLRNMILNNEIMLENAVKCIRDPEYFIAVKKGKCMICGRLVSEHKLEERVCLIFRKRGDEIGIKDYKGNYFLKNGRFCNVMINMEEKIVSISFKDYCPESFKTHDIEELHKIDGLRVVMMPMNHNFFDDFEGEVLKPSIGDLF